jgi:DNA repair protein RadC
MKKQRQIGLDVSNSPAEKQAQPWIITGKEFKLICLRETPNPADLAECDTPGKAAAYWQENIASNPTLNLDCECLAVLILNVRCRIKGYQIVSMGVMDTCLSHPREVFRPAIVAGAHSIVVMHNHPSGDPTPSEADITVTRELARAGKLLKIEVRDHVIVAPVDKTHRFQSLRELGYFYVV